MQVFVDSASPIDVIRGATLIKNYELSHNRLIDPTNPFLGSDLDLAIRNHVNGARPLTQDEAAVFLCSSSVMHALDGWIYLAHSIESLLKGDKGVSVHLAYYAELRASMSFLAKEGIGVLNHKHFCLDNGGGLQFPPGDSGTHSFAWKALNAYISSTVKNKDEILTAFKFQGRTFLEWLAAIPNSSSIMADQVIKDWLKEWSFDVRLFQADKDLRNDVSYRPKKLTDNYLLDLGYVTK